MIKSLVGVYYYVCYIWVFWVFRSIVFYENDEINETETILNMITANQAMSSSHTVDLLSLSKSWILLYLKPYFYLEDFLNKQRKNQQLITNHFSIQYLINKNMYKLIKPLYLFKFLYTIFSYVYLL